MHSAAFLRRSCIGESLLLRLESRMQFDAQVDCKMDMEETADLTGLILVWPPRH